MSLGLFLDVSPCVFPLPARGLWIHTCSSAPAAAQHTVMNRFSAAPRLCGKARCGLTEQAPVPSYKGLSLNNESNAVTASKTKHVLVSSHFYTVG